MPKDKITTKITFSRKRPTDILIMDYLEENPDIMRGELIRIALYEYITNHRATTKAAPQKTVSLADELDYRRSQDE